MTEIELIVGLKIPDNVAITTFRTLKKLGYESLLKIKREDYYKFSTNEDFKGFSEKIGKVDVLVNANKHRFSVKPAKEPLPKGQQDVLLLVQENDGSDKGLLHLLHGLGFAKLKKVERGILWTLALDCVNREEIAHEIAKRLLVNENYQRYNLI